MKKTEEASHAASLHQRQEIPVQRQGQEDDRSKEAGRKKEAEEMMLDRAERLRRKIQALELLMKRKPSGCSSCRERRLRRLRSRLADEENRKASS